MLRNATGRLLALLETAGRHPMALLVLPSIWMFWRFLPFWKDVDVASQLLWLANGNNILHAPPIYSFVSRIPFWLTDKFLSGRAPSIFAEQHPTLTAVYTLVILQHVLLWTALRYFLFSLPFSDRNRGIVTLMLVSVASFYSFAHTCGSEAMTAVTWFLVFGAGARALTGRATWRTWVIYAAALLLAIGSRHVNGLLAAWLPIAALVLIGFRWYSRERQFPGSVSTDARVAGLAILLSLAAIGVNRCLVSYLCKRFNVIERSTLGSTLSDRIATLVNHLSRVERDRLLVKVTALTTDPNVRLAIESQIMLGSYYLGTEEVIQAALEKQGWQGEELRAEKDRIILQATMCFYETLDPRLIVIVLKEFTSGWAPTSDYRVALSGPLATFLFARTIESEPSRWSNLPRLPIFELPIAHRMLERAKHDPFLSHWQGIPILVWCLLFAVVGVWRMRRETLRPELLLIGLTFLGIGVAVYGATCVCVFSEPRYVLPLLVSVYAFGSIVLSKGTWRIALRRDLDLMERPR
jgi:hypothetical protein